MRLLLLINFFIFNVLASPIVIYDSGQTINASGFYPFDYPDATQLQVKYSIQSMKLFPVETPGMNVGKIMPRKIQTQLHTPVCIIGDDKVSKQYLSSNYVSLEKLSAVCYAVNVRSEDSFNALQNIAPKLSIIPANGDEFVKLLGVRNYPALIASGFIR